MAMARRVQGSKHPHICTHTFVQEIYTELILKSPKTVTVFGHGEVRVYRGTGVSHKMRRTTW